MIRISTTIIVSCILVYPLYGQFIPNVGQAFQLAPSYNPSFTGIENYGDLKLMYRYQWVAFADAPTYLYASYYGRVTQPFNPADQTIRTSEEAAKALEQRIPRGRMSFVGAGGQVHSETRGPLEQKGVQFNAAYHYPLSKKWKLSFGLSAVVNNIKLRLDKITLENPDQDELYNRLLSEGSSYTTFNLRSSFLFYHSRFYFGITYIPLVNKALQDAGDKRQHRYDRAVVNAGYSMNVNPDLQLKPSIMGLVSKSGQLQFDYSVKAYIRERVWGGLIYRDVKSAVAMIGFMLNPSIGFAYSYERSLDTFNQFNDGSHELIVNFRLQNIKKENPYTW